MQIRIGLKGFRIAELTKDESATTSESGTASVAYEEIKVLPDVQNINLTARVQSQNVDADDVTTVLNMCTGYDGTVQRTFFTPEEQAELLGEKTVDGIVMSTDNDVAPEFAVGFQTQLSDGKILAMWLLRAKFSVSDFTGETKGSETLNPQSDTVSFKSLTRAADNAWRFYKVVDDEADLATFFSDTTLQKLATATEDEI